MTGTLTRKTLAITFTLGNGTFAGTSSASLTLRGLKARVMNSLAGGVSADRGHVEIYGMTQSQMNQLSTYGVPVGNTFNNRISIQAGDASAMSLMFDGAIWDAFADYDSMPNVGFRVTALSTLYQAVQQIPQTSISGPSSAATVMGIIAEQMGYVLENSGVNVQLRSPYFHGSPMDQIKACASAGNFNAYVDTIKKVLAIWPMGGSRTAAPLEISPQSGLIGYPTFSNRQLDFRTYYNPGLLFGRQVQITSSLKPACGLWTPMTIVHDLTSETPGGAWWSDVHCIAAQDR